MGEPGIKDEGRLGWKREEKRKGCERKIRRKDKKKERKGRKAWCEKK